MAKRERKRAERRLWPLLIGSIFFGVVGALLAAAYLSNLEQSLIARLQPEAEPEVAVVVAARDLPRGTTVAVDYFQQLSMPARYVHSDAIAPEDFGQFEGRALTVALGGGKALLRSHLDEDFPIDFSDIVEKGRRALTVTVDEVNSVAGFIRPGNRVDLFVNIGLDASGLSAGAVVAGLRKVGLENFADIGSLQTALQNLPEGVNPSAIASAFIPKEVIMPVVQDVKVLATGREPYFETLDQLRQPQPRADGSYSSLTLDVSAKDAALITAALDKGDLLALLRNRADRGLADFTSVSVQDLFGNAADMARRQAEQSRKVTAAAGVNPQGDLVGADGKVLASRDALAAAGFTVDANGNVVDKDGNVVDPADLIVTADGTVMSRKQLEAAGLRVDAQGRIVDASGNVLDPDDVVVTKDGQVLSKSQLAAAGLSVDENGQIVDGSGRAVSPDGVVTTADGRVFTKEQLAKAGLSVDANGNVVDANGNVVDTADLVITADGKALSKSQLADAGLTVNANGEIVDSTGRVVSADDLVTTRDGKILSRAQLARAGLTVDENGNVVDGEGNVVNPMERLGSAIEAAAEPVAIDLIIGGASTDGVAKTTSLPAGGPPASVPAQ